MRKYEAIFIFRPEEDVFAKGKTEVISEFKNAGISILQEIDMGLRDLAYDIKKMPQGRYINFEIESGPEKLQPLNRLFKIKNEILKFVFFKKDE